MTRCCRFSRGLGPPAVSIPAIFIYITLKRPRPPRDSPKQRFCLVLPLGAGCQLIRALSILAWLHEASRGRDPARFDMLNIWDKEGGFWCPLSTGVWWLRAKQYTRWLRVTRIEFA